MDNFIREMDNFAKIIFLLMMCLTPLGVLSWFGYRRMANKAKARHEEKKAVEFQALSRWKLTGTLVDGTIGVIGYVLISRRVFQIDTMWIMLVLMSASAGMHLWFMWRIDQTRKGTSERTIRPKAI